MTKSDLSRLIFIDSSVNTHGDHAKVLVPPHPFGAVKSERIALTLISFCARRNWYNINATNNTFYFTGQSNTSSNTNIRYYYYYWPAGNEKLK